MIQRKDYQFDWSRKYGKSLTKNAGPDREALGHWCLYIESYFPITERREPGFAV